MHVAVLLVVRFSCLAFFFLLYHPLNDYLLSFPTRRSSDLKAASLVSQFRENSCLTKDPSMPATPSAVLRATLPTKPSHTTIDRKSTRLNSSHVKISYAVFCLKKKKE